MFRTWPRSMAATFWRCVTEEAVMSCVDNAVRIERCDASALGLCQVDQAEALAATGVVLALRADHDGAARCGIREVAPAVARLAGTGAGGNGLHAMVEPAATAHTRGVFAVAAVIAAVVPVCTLVAAVRV